MGRKGDRVSKAEARPVDAPTVVLAGATIKAAARVVHAAIRHAAIQVFILEDLSLILFLKKKTFNPPI
jgi:hypothetical protein